MPATATAAFAKTAHCRALPTSPRAADAIVAGPGLEANNAAAPLAAHLLRLGKPLALDAALLHVLPDCAAEARAATVPPILLPHAGEMASLLDCDIGTVEADPLAAGRACAKRYGAFVLVKGVKSHIVAPDGAAWKYGGGGPGLGVSGSGDTLAGITGGLLARGADPLTALFVGGLAPWRSRQGARKKVGPSGFLARDIPGEVPALLPH